MNDKARLFGFDFLSASSVDDVADMVVQDCEEAQGGHDILITPNAYITVTLSEKKNSEIKKFCSNARYVLPDGTPIVWLSRMKGKVQLKSRLTGSDLFPVLWRKIKKRLWPATFVLANEELCTLFANEYKQCNFAVPAFFDVKNEKYIRNFAGEVADKVITNQSRFVFLGITTPKQELLAYHIIDQLKARGYQQHVLLLLLGASYEFYFGKKDRAPEFIQKSGFEWLYRLCKEPRRLWKRYTVDNARFIALSVRELLS